MVKAKVHRGKAYSEKDLQKALDCLSSGESTNVSAVARQFHVQAGTLRNRWLGLHGSSTRAHEQQQLLDHVEEEALCDWIEHRSDIGKPFCKQTLLKRVKSICGKQPSKKWYRSFLGRHPDIKLGRPSGLDPKRAQAFNRTTVNEAFTELGEVLDEKEIPWANVYNMDEKGVQRGGGRRVQALKYFVPRNRRPKYRLRSGNLELVTIIECVCADGSSLTPGFVFPGKEFQPEWFEVDDDIRYFLVSYGTINVGLISVLQYLNVSEWLDR
jgi:hypothetical protein